MRFRNSLLAVFGFLFLTGITYNTNQEIKHSQWASLLMILGSEKNARAYTSNKQLNFSVDIPTTNCDNYMITMIGDLNYIADKSVESSGHEANLRVDEYSIHKAQMTIYTERGDKVWYASIHGIENSPDFFNEMKVGSLLRVQTVISDATEYHRFSLYGSRAAIDRAVTLCRQNAAPRDEEYFDEPEQEYIPRPDSEYF